MKLKIRKNRNVKFFSSDEEFTDFCVAPYAEIKEFEYCVGYVGAYSQEYIDCVEFDTIFLI